MDTLNFILLIVVVGLAFLVVYLISNTNTVKMDLDKRDEEHKKALSRLESDLAAAKKEAQALAQQKREKKEKPQPQRSEKNAEPVVVDPADLEKALAEAKRLRVSLDDARAEVESRKESVRDAQATFARLREENEELTARVKSLEKSVDDTRQRATRDVERAVEREKEKAEDKELFAPPSSDVGQELKREKARLEEKYGDRIARLEERLKQRDEQGKQRDERKEASEQSRSTRLERQLQEAREFIRKKGADLAVASNRLLNLERAYKAAKSDVELLQDQVAYLKNEVPTYTPKAKDAEAKEPEVKEAEAKETPETPSENA